MKIEQVNSLISTLGTIGKNVQGGDFDKELSIALATQNQKKSDDLRIGSVDEFRDQLTQLGSYAFLNVLNSQKIEEKIEQKRQELKEQLGLNKKNLSKSETEGLEKILEEMLGDYKKELMARLQNNSIVEKAKNLNAKNNAANFTLSDLINLV